MFCKMFSYLRQTPSLMYITSKRMKSLKHVSDRVEFVKLRDIVKERYSDIWVQPNSVTKGTWEDIRKLATEVEVMPELIDTFILRIFQDVNCPDAGISYYKFLESNNYNPTIVARSMYLQMYNLKDNLTVQEKKHILKLYNDISAEYTVLNEQLTNVLVKALCKIGEWKEAIQILEKYETYSKDVLGNAYSSLIEYFYKNEQVELGYKYLGTLMRKGQGPLMNAYDAYLEYCYKERDKFNERVEKMFELWSKNAIKPSQEVTNKYIMICNEMGWSAKLTAIQRGTCSVCKQVLAGEPLTDQEYKRLQEVTKEKLIFDKMYYVTKPREIQTYMNFVHRNKPFDIILDGLNILYRSYYSKNLAKIEVIIDHFYKQKKKILVIGKRHMAQLIHDSDMKRKAMFFLVNDWSSDDEFLLYAAFSSGKNVKVVTHDQLRQHKFAVDDLELNAMFIKWQSSHHYVHVNSRFGTAELKQNPLNDSIVQKHNNTWHVPYVPSQFVSRQRHSCNYSWACFTKPS